MLTTNSVVVTFPVTAVAGAAGRFVRHMSPKNSALLRLSTCIMFAVRYDILFMATSAVVRLMSAAYNDQEW